MKNNGTTKNNGGYTPEAIFISRLIIMAIIKKLTPHYTETIAKRFVVFVLLAVNIAFDTITELTEVKKSTLYNYRNDLLQVKCVDDVIQLLELKNGNGRTSQVEGVEDVIKENLKNNNYFSLRSICDMLKAQLSLNLSETRVSEIIKSLGFRKLKCGSIPFKADVQAQRKFYDEVLLPLMNDAKMGNAVVYFMDGVHFVMGCDYLGGVYTLSRRFIKTLSGRFRYNVLGAINYATQEMVTVCDDVHLNAECVCEMLRKIAALNPGKSVSIILDNAKYQKCYLVQNEAKDLGINLVYIPPYSPNLNLIERVWKFAKSELRTRAYNDPVEFKKVIDSIMASTETTNKDRVKGLLGEKVQLFDDFVEIDENTFEMFAA